MVHESFRFQPWHREIKRLLDARAIGERLHTLAFNSRPGDGWAPDAYLAQQPYFRQMRRFLVHETGIHFMNTFRFLGGEIGRVYAILKRLNPAIAGEDRGLLVFEFREGAIGVWDANRFNESNTTDPRYTFGEFLVEGDGGSLRLAQDGSLSIQPLGQPERPHPYDHSRQGFAGDCVHASSAILSTVSRVANRSRRRAALITLQISWSRKPATTQRSEAYRSTSPSCKISNSDVAIRRLF